MTRAAKHDLTEGPIFGKLISLAIPLMGGMLMQMLYNLTDMFWLGRLGSEAVAAAGTAGLLMWMSFAFAAFGRMGGEIGVSQNLGRGDEKKAKEFATTALTLGLVLGVLYGTVLIFAHTPLINFFNIENPTVVAYAENYIRITGFAMPLFFIGGAGMGIYSGSGNTKTPFYIQALGITLNVILSPIFIFTLGFGVEGAAFATVIAQSVTIAIFLCHIKFHKNRPFKDLKLLGITDQKTLMQIFKWVIPIAIESFLFTFLTMMVSRFVNQFGTGAMATQRIGSQIESLSWLISTGFASAISAFTGQNFGAGKWKRIREGYKISVIIMLIWGIFTTAVLFFAGGPLFAIFLPGEPEVIAMGANYMRILAACQILGCLEGITSGTFRGMGKTVPPSVVSASSNFIRMVAAFFLARTVLGLDGIWWALTLGAMLRGAWIFIWFRLHSKKMPKEDVVAESAV